MFSKLLDILNDLQPRQLLLLAGGTAIVMFAVIYFALVGLTSKEEEPTPTPVPKVAMRSVVVAKEDIAPRVVLQENMLEVKDVPSGSAPQGSVMTLQEVVGQPTVSTVYAGDVITVQKVFMDKNQAGFVGSIPANCRAVSVGISEITGVAGFAKPGDYVDVVLVEKGDLGATSRMLLQNVLLLGVNKDTEGTAAKGKAESPAIATLALEPDDTLAVVSAAAIGELYLVLRPFRPSNMYVMGTDYTLRSSQPKKPATSASAQPVPAAPPAAYTQAAPAPAASSSGIQIIQGDEVLKR